MEKLIAVKTELMGELVQFIRKEFDTGNGIVPLHEPLFAGNERKYVMDAINSTFVSSVGAYVDKFEQLLTAFTGAAAAVAVVNGTSALHIALLLAGVKADEEVLTQPLTFVATANAISYTGAHPVFVDVDRDTLGLSPEKLTHFINQNLKRVNGNWVNKKTGRIVKACMPMHTFGLPARIDEIIEICDAREIPVVEDSAESLGSTYKGGHTGTFGKIGIFSFNGNKTITCGGGGAIVTNDRELARKAKHLTTTAKKPHRWEYVHDETGYNYRLPNLNAALACAQMEMLEAFVESKRALAQRYHRFLETLDIEFVKELPEARSNFWLNAIVLSGREERNDFLEYMNEHKVMSRPVWRLLNKLPMYKNACAGDLSNAEWLEDRVINIPSSPRI